MSEFVYKDQGWSQGIDTSEVRLLGSFDIPRGKTSGPIRFESPDLLEFVRGDSTGEVGFLIVRATRPLDSWSLVHAFASTTQPTCLPARHHSQWRGL